MLQPNDQLDRYRIVRLLATGGMGMVYEAVHVELHKRVVVKLLPPALITSETVSERFLREGRLAASIRHPHIVEVYDVGKHAEGMYLVMEFLDGGDLSAYVKQHQGRLPASEAADLMLPILAAVARIHEAGIIHRDLKPQNILLTQGELGDWVPKLADFGISKFTGGASVLTQAGDLMGSPPYMSPEQAMGKEEVNADSDQYALGVILYELTTGQRPYTAPNIPALLFRIIMGERQKARAVRPDIPEAMEALIERALSIKAENRFDNVTAMGHALWALCSEPVQAQWRRRFGGPAAPGTRVPAAPTAAPAAAPAHLQPAGVPQRVATASPPPRVATGVPSRVTARPVIPVPPEAEAKATVASRPVPVHIEPRTVASRPAIPVPEGRGTPSRPAIPVPPLERSATSRPVVPTVAPPDDARPTVASRPSVPVVPTTGQVPGRATVQSLPPQPPRPGVSVTARPVATRTVPPQAMQPEPSDKTEQVQVVRSPPPPPPPSQMAQPTQVVLPAAPPQRVPTPLRTPDPTRTPPPRTPETRTPTPRSMARKPLPPMLVIEADTPSAGEALVDALSQTSRICLVFAHRIGEAFDAETETPLTQVMGAAKGRIQVVLLVDRSARRAGPDPLVVAWTMAFPGRTDPLGSYAIIERGEPLVLIRKDPRGPLVDAEAITLHLATRLSGITPFRR